MHEASVTRESRHYSSHHLAFTAARTRLAQLQSLSVDERRALGETALASRTVRAGDSLVCQDQATGSIHFLAAGWGCRFKLGREDRRQISTLLVPGDVCNLDALMFARPDYGVCMLTAGTVLSLPRDHAVALAAEHPGIARSFTWLGFVENAILAQWALGLGRQSARERVAHLLCELATRLGCGDGEGQMSFDLPLTQEHLADVLGLTSVHINRTLRQLLSEGLISSVHRRVTVHDVAALRRIADFSPTYLHVEDAEAGPQATPEHCDTSRSSRHVSS